MDEDNLSDEQFAEMVQAECSPAAKRIAELERENARLREACLLASAVSATPLEYGYKVGPEFNRAKAACANALSA